MRQSDLLCTAAPVPIEGQAGPSPPRGWRGDLRLFVATYVCGFVFFLVLIA